MPRTLLVRCLVLVAASIVVMALAAEIGTHVDQVGAILRRPAVREDASYGVIALLLGVGLRAVWGAPEEYRD